MKLFFGNKPVPKVVDAVTAIEAGADKLRNALSAQKEGTMATQASAVNPAAVSTAPHPAWYSRAATWLLNVGKAIKNGIAKAAGEEPAIAAAIAAVAPTAEALSNLLVPGSGSFEAHLLDVYGVVANGVKDAGAASAANGINITLDETLVNDIKTFLPQVEAFLHPAASPAPPPATVPAPVVGGGGVVQRPSPVPPGFKPA